MTFTHRILTCGAAFIAAAAGPVTAADAVRNDRAATVAPTLIPSAWAADRFHSDLLNADVEYLAYLPAGYDEKADARYPVVYLLHGRGDSMQAWHEVKAELDRLIGSGRIPAVIAIAPDAPFSQRASYYIDSEFRGIDAPSRLPPGRPVESVFTRELIPTVDARYRTQTDRGGRVVAGYSMGGYGALRFSLAHPQLFGAAVVLSPAVYVPEPPASSSTREFGAFGRGSTVFDPQVYRAQNYPALLPGFEATQLPLAIFIAVGDQETALRDPAEASHDLDYEAHTVYNRLRRVPTITAQLRVVSGGHGWDTWRPTFAEGLVQVLGVARTPRLVDGQRTSPATVR